MLDYERKGLGVTTYTLTESRLIDLNSLDSSLLEVDDFVTEGKGELLALQFTRDIRSRERPVENCHRPSKHTLHGLLGDALSIAAPLDCNRTGAADVRDQNGGTDVSTRPDKVSIEYKQHPKIHTESRSFAPKHFE